ncbi:MAG: hypothetical protein LPD71_04970 [Shewanella sp.]|nr:hypothetical protein [Shewanella sp.]MCF1430052.1 hypothetical protein [Shewanella sp.]MCF1438115.1 hypothetical protein [Shewanella sp.]MCF1458557.1 hypothetical protein [Shewanella sp.]
MPPRGLSKYLATKSKARIAEPFGQRLSSLSTALTLIYVEQLHHNRVALYKTTPKSCKNHLQRSTDPSETSTKKQGPALL